VDQEQAALLGDQVAAPGEGGGGAGAGAGEGGGDALGRLVLVDVAGLQTGGDDALDAGGRQRRDVLGGKAAALLEGQAVLAQRVGEQRALGLGGGQACEDHATASPSSSGLAGALTSGGAPRRAAVTWARIETAISAGLRAPMARPTGAAMRAICASDRPAARSRSRRLAWVRVEPSAPT